MPSVKIHGVPYYCTSRAAQKLGVSNKRFLATAEALGLEPDGWSAFINRLRPLALWGRESIRKIGDSLPPKAPSKR